MPWKLAGGSKAADQKLFFYVLVTQSRPALYNPVDCSPPGSSVERISQARIVEWVAISSSRGSSQPRDQTQVSYVSCSGRWVLYRQCHLGSPRNCTWKRLSLPLGSQASKTFYTKRACAQGEGGGWWWQGNTISRRRGKLLSSLQGGQVSQSLVISRNRRTSLIISRWFHGSYQELRVFE